MDKSQRIIQYKKVYYDPKHPASFGSAKTLRKAVGGSLDDAKNWLRSQETYTLHRPIRKRFSRNKIQVAGIDDQWEADLIDVQSLQKENKGYKYILTVIDTLSKYAWAVPIKDKSGDTMVNVFKIIFKERCPRKLRTDRGKEFMCKKLQDLLKEKNIIYFTSNNETKAAIVERFNKTLRSKIWKYFTAHKTQKFIDVLPKIVHAYNNRVHSTIGIEPAKVNLYNAENIWRRLYQYTAEKKYKTPRLVVGDLVRISKAKGIFEQGYKTNWTKEIFMVKRVFKKLNPEYSLQDLKGEDILGKFLDIELQKITLNTTPSRPQRASKTRGARRIRDWIKNG